MKDLSFSFLKNVSFLNNASFVGFGYDFGELEKHKSYFNPKIRAQADKEQGEEIREIKGSVKGFLRTNQDDLKRTDKFFRSDFISSCWNLNPIHKRGDQMGSSIK